MNRKAELEKEIIRPIREDESVTAFQMNRIQAEAELKGIVDTENRIREDIVTVLDNHIEPKQFCTFGIIEEQGISNKNHIKHKLLTYLFGGKDNEEIN